MDILIYINAFIMGVVFGSFFTLAVHRIPLKQDILYTRSYCPNCNHRLEFLDLIPILSYVFLRGKCRYCKEPIRIRYLLLEALSGIAFLFLALSMKLSVFSTIATWINFIFMILNLIGLFITIGIYKQYKNLSVPIIIYLLIISIMYNFIVGFSIIRFISLIITAILILYYSKLNNKYIIYEILLMFFYFLSFYENIVIFSTIILCFFVYLIVLLFYMVKFKSIKKITKSYVIILIISNILSVIVTNFYIRWHI